MDAGRLSRPLGRSLVRLVAGVVVVTYVAVAMVGTLHVDPRALVVSMPVLGVLGAVLARAGYRFLDPHSAPSPTRSLPTAIGTALLVPFLAGVVQLGDLGAYLLLLAIPLGTVLAGVWAYDLEISTASTTPDVRQMCSTVRSPESGNQSSPPHELLRTLPLDDLIAEWRSSAEQLHPPSDSHWHTAVRWRGALLEELRRRDPAGFGEWLLDGTLRGPEDHIRARSEDTRTSRPDESAR